jgi:uncharacterized membrane protein
MALEQHQRAVGTFPTRQEAEDALNELRNSGFPMDKVSVIAKDADRDDQIAGADVKNRAQGNEAKEGAGAGAVAGTALGGVGGLLVGLGTLAIPGVGPFLAAGTLATTFAGAGIGAAAGSLVGALTGLGIPEEQAKVYGDLVSQGDYLVIVDGDESEIHRAASILSHRGIRDWGVFDTSNEYDSAHAQSYKADVAPSVNDASNVYSDTTTTNQDVVEIVDHRNQVR